MYQLRTVQYPYLSASPKPTSRWQVQYALLSPLPAPRRIDPDRSIAADTPATLRRLSSASATRKAQAA